MSEPERIDKRDALNWLEGDERMFLKIMAIFMKNVPAQVNQLKVLLEGDDIAAVERAAHTIMGSSAMLGAKQMSEAAKHIEYSAIAGDMSAARLHFVQLAEECEKVMAELAVDGGKG